MAELQSRMSSREFSEWMLLYNTEPMGERRGDMQAALVAWVVANVNRGEREAYDLKDFLLQFESEQEEKSPRELFQVLKDALMLTGQR